MKSPMYKMATVGGGRGGGGFSIFFLLEGGYKVMWSARSLWAPRACFPDSLVNGAKRVNSSVCHSWSTDPPGCTRAPLALYYVAYLPILLHNTRHFHTVLVRVRFFS